MHEIQTLESAKLVYFVPILYDIQNRNLTTGILPRASGTVPISAQIIFFSFSGKANPDSLLILLEAANQVLLFISLFNCNFNHANHPQKTVRYRTYFAWLEEVSDICTVTSFRTGTSPLPHQYLKYDLVKYFISNQVPLYILCHLPLFRIRIWIRSGFIKGLRSDPTL